MSQQQAIIAHLINLSEECSKVRTNVTPFQKFRNWSTIGAK
jgi:hypothetical protein